MVACWAGTAGLLCCLAGVLVIGMDLDTPIVSLPVQVRSRWILGWYVGDGYFGPGTARMALRSDHALELQLPESSRRPGRLLFRPRSPGSYDWPSAAWALARADWSAGHRRLLIMCDDSVRTEEVVRAIDLGAGLGFGRRAIALETDEIAWDDGPPPVE
jgi:hypothetical protein